MRMQAQRKLKKPKGFGFERLLEEKLMEQFSAQQEVVAQIIVFARNMLDNTQGGLIAGIGAMKPHSY